MTAAIKRTGVLPTPDESALAEASGKVLAHLINKKQRPKFEIIEGRKSQQVEVPVTALKLFVDILEEMADGNSVSLVTVQQELTTQEAADILNVSRPFFVQLVEEGKIPFRKVGSKRRVFAKDVLAFKKKSEKERLKVLERLSAQAQKLNMGY